MPSIQYVLLMYAELTLVKIHENEKRRVIQTLYSLGIHNNP